MKYLFSFLFILNSLSLGAHASVKLNAEKAGNFIFENDAKALTSGVQIVLQTGSLLDPKGKEGLSRIATQALLRGTKNKTRTEFYTMLERMGANISIDNGASRTIISLEAINENLESSIALLAEAILSPAIKEEEMKLLMEEELAHLNQEKSNNRSLLKRTVQQVLFRGTPLAFPDEGTIDGVKNITVADIKAFLESNIKSENLLFAATSNRSRNEIQSLIEKNFSSVPEGKAPTVPELTFSPPTGKTLFLVHRKGSSTTEMAIAQLGITANNPMKNELDLAQFIFGSDFTSRLPTVLRKENGWTYGAYASYHMLDKPRRYGSAYLIYAFPQAQFTDKTTLKSLEMFDDFIKNGLTSKELLFAKNSLANSYPFDFASSKSRLVARLYQKLDGAQLLSVSAYKKKINGFTLAQVKEAIQNAHNPNNLIIVLVGDPEKLQPMAKLIPNLANTIEVEDPMKLIYTQ